MKDSCFEGLANGGKRAKGSSAVSEQACLQRRGSLTDWLSNRQDSRHGDWVRLEPGSLADNSLSVLLAFVVGYSMAMLPLFRANIPFEESDVVQTVQN